MLTPAAFASKWVGSKRTERAAAQEHFIDLCQMLGVPTPNEDPSGENYAFEKGAEKIDGSNGFADVWRRGYFGWEYKGPWKDLKAAYNQLLLYREALENPPLLVVCDLNRFEVHTNFTNTPKQVHPFTLLELRDEPEEPLRILRAVMQHPDELKPGTTKAELTAEAAKEFASLADRLRSRGHEPQEVAHFLNKLVFCMFAEDSELLPPGLIRRLTAAAQQSPDTFKSGLNDLFSTMADKGGLFGAERIEWFNGGLFDGGSALPMTPEEIGLVGRVSTLDWSQVEPAIFGTLFERGLDPSKRSQLGAHYTDRVSIERLIEPVLIAPLRRDFEATKKQVEALVAEGKKVTKRTPASKNPAAAFNSFLDRLRAVRVLDPACGSGNFLYLALQALKDLEREALLWVSLTLKVPIGFPEVGPKALLGIELNSYAAELTRVVIWIGEIQWMLSNGFNYLKDPILRPLDNISCRDALLDPTESAEPEWPEATVIVGNPPFLGGKLMRANLGDEYVDALFSVYKGRVPREADFVCYWHEKARAMVEAGKVQRTGLLATQGIRGGASRRVLDRVKETGDIFLAWDDEPWVVEGAAVHVSFVGFDDGSQQERFLDDHPVTEINSDLTAGLDLTRVHRLPENLGISFMGDTKGGPFDIGAAPALAMLDLPNPDGRSNRDVVRPWVNGLDLTRRPRGMWIIDFGTSMPIEDAALYEAPFEYVKEHVKPQREKSRSTISEWWLHERRREDMREALAGLSRFVVTPRVSKHRLFVWCEAETLPDSATIAFARDNDYFFGVLHSSVHELWARRLGTQVREAESGFRYTPTTTFETFPFPEHNDHTRAEIEAAAEHLDVLRNSWLNPAGGPDNELRGLTLTNLYNRRPSWLANAHERLDRAVHAAYGWEYPLEPEDVLARLVELNLARAAKEELPLELLAQAKASARKRQDDALLP
jgi:type II restriction/modification system DNA methylase subunit YeeA